MDFVERYRTGEHQQVWNDLQALGPAVRREPNYAQAREVAAETMRRVRRNCERLVSRLGDLGYVFGTFPDGSRRSFKAEPLTAPSDRIRADSTELETQAGLLPISLVAFWQEVGAVDLVGMHRGWPDGLDPLVVDPPEGALSFLFDMEDDEGETEGPGGLPAWRPTTCIKTTSAEATRTVCACQTLRPTSRCCMSGTTCSSFHT